ncbi:MAG: hypothetical protein ACPGSG_11460 [Prolixibacteraceae bacterium]
MTQVKEALEYALKLLKDQADKGMYPELALQENGGKGFSPIVEALEQIDTPNDRIFALEWWRSISFDDQFFKTIKWLSSQNRDITERHPHSLTGREIQEIYEFLLKRN